MHSLRACTDLQLANRSERLIGAFVGQGAADVLGLTLVKGALTEAEDSAWISDRAWKTILDDDPHVIGRQLTVAVGDAVRELRSVTVVAVVKESAPLGQLRSEVWLPTAEAFPIATAGVRPQYVIALDPQRFGGVGAVNALLEKNALAILSEHPANLRAALHFRAEPINRLLAPGTAEVSLLFSGVLVATLIVICCTAAIVKAEDVAGARQAIEIRWMLGASRMRAVAPLLLEATASSLVALLVGGLSAMAVWTVVRSQLDLFWMGPLALQPAEAVLTLVACSAGLFLASICPILLTPTVRGAGGRAPNGRLARRAVMGMVVASSVVIAGLLPVLVSPVVSA